VALSACWEGPVHSAMKMNILGCRVSPKQLLALSPGRKVALSDELGDVPMEDVVLFTAGRAERAYPATEQQRRADGDENRR
jgi:hypothetical protein